MSIKTFNLLPPEREILTLHAKASPKYLSARTIITRHLINYTLIESFHKFQNAEQPYPFVKHASLKPGSVTPIKEYSLEGSLPKKLRKHFRCRRANRVRKKTIAEVAPDLPGLENYDGAGRNVHHPAFNSLASMLLPLDYALLIQDEDHISEMDEPVFRLTNFHVKIEQLTDNALRALGIQLNYLERRLYERGERFVEAMEKKFFEYFNFYHNAAGRKSAAALASQLLAQEKQIGVVFMASQQDRRLTLLSSHKKDQDVHIEQYVLLRISPKQHGHLTAWCNEQGLDFDQHYVAARTARHAIVVLKVTYEHTEAAKPSPDGLLKTNINLRKKWVQLREQSLIPLDSNAVPRIEFPVAYRRKLEDTYRELEEAPDPEIPELLEDIFPDAASW